MYCYLFIVAAGVLSVFDCVASICPNPVTNGEQYYCKEKNISCLQCNQNTSYHGTCKIKNTVSDCRPCPPGTWNPKPYHLDRHCQENKLDADRATDDKCIHPMVNGDMFYCLDTGFVCIMCMKHTRYVGPCTENYKQAICVPCPPGTSNPKPYHLDRHCQANKLDADRATDDKCIHPMVNGDMFYCLDTGFVCIMCMKHTRYVGPCTENYTQAICVPCQPETWNPIEFHIDKDCVPMNPNDDAVIKSPEDIRIPRDRQRKKVMEVTDQSSDNNQGIRLLMNPLFCFVLWLFTTIFPLLKLIYSFF